MYCQPRWRCVDESSEEVIQWLFTDPFLQVHSTCLSPSEIMHSATHERQRVAVDPDKWGEIWVYTRGHMGFVALQFSAEFQDHSPSFLL